MKTEKEQELEFEGLSKVQQDTFLAVKEHKMCHDMCLQMARRYSLVEMQRALNEYRKKEMTFQEYMMFKVEIKELYVKEREMFNRLYTDYCVNPLDEYLALQTVKTYDVDGLEEIIRNHKKGSIDISTLAEEFIIGKCKHKEIIVEADEEMEEDPKYDPGSVPF